MKKIITIFAIGLASLVAAQTLPKVGNPKADAYIERLVQMGWRAEGASLSFDERTLYLSLCKPPRTVCDLYISHIVNDDWPMPTRIDELSTETDEWSPSISSDEQTIYFIRRDIVGEGTRKEESKSMIYCAHRQSDGHWQAPEWMLISNGKDSQLRIYPDNKLLTFYSMGRDEDGGRKETPRCYYVTKIDKYNWTLPALLQTDPEQLMTPVKTLTGKVIDHTTKQPIKAQTNVYDVLTQQLISSHATDENGAFRLALPMGRTYRVEVCKDGYSKAYIRSNEDAQPAFEQVELTPQLTLNVRVFDNDIFTPLHYDMVITNDQTKEKKVIKGQDKRSSIQLPIGREYILHLSKQGYADTTYAFDTRCDVLTAQTDVDLYMRSGRVRTSLQAVDSETGESIAAQYTLCSYDSQTGDNEDKNTVYTDTMLQCSQQYHLFTTAQGYLFYDTLFSTLPSEGSMTIQVPMMSIRQAATVQLKNIEFEFNSYLLKDESYDELKRVAQLLRQNPTLRIELSAHTDDVGSADYNLRLSQKRGNTVAHYLIEKEGIEPERLIAKGYGKTKPLVPNTSDANRAINRRVEFTILEL